MAKNLNIEQKVLYSTNTYKYIKFTTVNLLCIVGKINSVQSSKLYTVRTIVRVHVYTRIKVYD